MYSDKQNKKKQNCPRNSTFSPLLIATFYHLRGCPIAKPTSNTNKAESHSLSHPLDSPRSSPESAEKRGIPFKEKPGQAEVKAGSKRAAPALRCQLGFSLSLCHFRGDVRGFITQGHDSLLMDERKSAEKQNKTRC